MDRDDEFLEALKGEDDLGVVVRTHIVIEQQLNEFIDSFMAKPEVFRKIHMDYFDRVSLALALGMETRFEKPLKCLGKIRNGFSHKLRPNISKEDTNNLYQALTAADKVSICNNYNKMFRETRAGKPEFKQLPPKEQFILHAAHLFACLQAWHIVQREMRDKSS